MNNVLKEVLPGIFRAKIPLPHNPLKFVNSYIVLDDEKTLVIDIGFNRSECKNVLMAALDSLDRPWNSVQILATHSHPDHIGLLADLPKTAFPVLAGFGHIDEVLAYEKAEATIADPLVNAVARDIASGALNEASRSMEDIKPSYEDDRTILFELAKELRLSPINASIKKLGEGDVLTAGRYCFEVEEIPGHDNWHICLCDRSSGIMIVGDHVLRRITPSIGSLVRDSNVLRSYLQSLQRMPDENNIIGLPAHGDPIAHLAAEANRITAHHLERLQEFHNLVHLGYDNLATIAANANWRYPDWYNWNAAQQLFSMRETLAHLIELESEGRIRILNEGRYLYRFEPSAG